jgi:hypothetical protein
MARAHSDLPSDPCRVYACLHAVPAVSNSFPPRHGLPPYILVDANAEHKGTAGHVTLNTKDIADYKYRIDILPLLQRAMRLPRLEIHIQYDPSTAYCEPDDDGTEFHDDLLERRCPQRTK